MTSRRASLFVLPLLASLLAGCDMLGIESPEKLAAAREAEGRAVGGACRHAGRAIEDCYALNRKADKSAVFAGWRDMNDYMRENKIEAVTPQIAPQAVAPKPPAESEGTEPSRKDKEKEKDGAKAPAKGH